MLFGRHLVSRLLGAIAAIHAHAKRSLQHGAERLGGLPVHPDRRVLWDGGFPQDERVRPHPFQADHSIQALARVADVMNVPIGFCRRLPGRAQRGAQVLWDIDMRGPAAQVRGKPDRLPRDGQLDPSEAGLEVRLPDQSSDRDRTVHGLDLQSVSIGQVDLQIDLRTVTWTGADPRLACQSRRRRVSCSDRPRAAGSAQAHALGRDHPHSNRASRVLDPHNRLCDGAGVSPPRVILEVDRF